ncbi:phosphatidate cytidylyltransferase [Serinicoccus chungangensis]|uniref:Phosphatidate cytidylyltransferase n=1 Tax=Serinicoccus chungangensis TaxID=767452 RepID=A0A0W8I1P8_9MICO|nr:phosphatidate cytidylyltransferase [Serinicoccus chungangensis]KUG51570.1 phosphatidate cytidylyltransferase [Serinicoccus chungangensis]
MTDPSATAPATPDPGTRAAAGSARRSGRPSRAGRNLPAAIGVGVGLVLVILASLVFWKAAFVYLVTAAAVVGVWELDQALRTGRVDPPRVPVFASVALVPLAYYQGADALAVGFAAATALILLWRSVGSPRDAARDVAGGVYIVAYVPLLAAIASLMLAQPDGVGRIITFILVTVASDTGGYAVGVLRGRTPMSPSLSPKKSWEGFAGSVATSAVVGSVCVLLLLDGAWWAGLVVGACAAAFATVGDLAESAIKRDLGIKDMGSILPGHGGVMDRLDSLVVTAPVCWALLHLLV